MTCIVGYIDKISGNIIFGGDSAGVQESSVRKLENEKVFTKGDMIFGYVGSYRIGQLVQYSLIIPQNKEANPVEYLINKFIPELQKCIEKGKCLDDSWELMLGYKQKLYHIFDNFQIGIIRENFNACGCGEKYAIGALRSLEDSKRLTAEDKVAKVLKIAEEFSSGVKSPFIILTLEHKNI